MVDFLKMKRFQIKRYISALINKNDPSIQNADIIWVQPDEIERELTDQIKISDVHPLVDDGNWDLNTTNFADNIFYKSARAHFLHNKSWQETESFKKNLSEIQNGVQRFGCTNENELVRRYLRWDELYDSIKKNGYKSAQELIGEPRDEINVAIGRYGKILFNNGRHRLAICKILGVRSIPVFVILRHAEWVQFKRDISNFAGRRRNQKLYADIPHSDLAEFRGSQDANRFLLMKENLLPEFFNPGGNSNMLPKLLDIGANLGHFSILFNRLGFDCCAVEYEPVQAYFLKRLSKSGPRPFEVFEGSIFNFMRKRNMEFDVVLAMSIFHHFLKEKEIFQLFKELLSKIQAKQMFFQPHAKNSKQMKNAYAYMDPDDFVEFIIQNSIFTQVCQIGTGSDDRSIYSLT